VRLHRLGVPGIVARSFRASASFLTEPRAGPARRGGTPRNLFVRVETSARTTEADRDKWGKCPAVFRCFMNPLRADD